MKSRDSESIKLDACCHWLDWSHLWLNESAWLNGSDWIDGSTSLGGIQYWLDLAGNVGIVLGILQ